VTLEPIDLHFRQERVIGVYLLETPAGPALLDCGPSTCAAALEAGLTGRGLALTDVPHLLLTHIHLDHAGAAGTLVRRHPGLQVHVSAVGAPHVVDPSRLEASARRIYGDTFDALWGDLLPVPEENVHVAGDSVLGLECFPTPGHASHHVCYLDGGGTLYAGDATGVRILPGRSVQPHAPPPDIDLGAWVATLDAIERRAPERLALIHFGVADDAAAHLDRTRETLALWAGRVRSGLTEGEFVAAGRRDLEAEEPGLASAYAQAAPLFQSYQGLRRYWDKRAA
jgi:glyoxylase-like metal-dependent hydrolase (beta-lactamase superfamily II)